MIVLAIDPGSEQSAYVLWDGEQVLQHGIDENADVLDMLSLHHGSLCASTLVIEQIESYGMPVGREIFSTVHWSGRFYQAWRGAGHAVEQLPRREVKLHLCHSARANDASIRCALLDRFGGREKAIGKKAAPGPLHGMRADLWQALALAITFYDQNVKEAA